MKKKDLLAVAILNDAAAFMQPARLRLRRVVPGDGKSARRRCARRKDLVLSFFLRADACGDES
ncbi:MAG: hypothetical protein IKQ87_00520, partial [Clostridia bacterium]|nr:hypothetical protein [Clostridia bacterium]